MPKVFRSTKGKTAKKIDNNNDAEDDNSLENNEKKEIAQNEMGNAGVNNEMADDTTAEIIEKAEEVDPSIFLKTILS